MDHPPILYSQYISRPPPVKNNLGLDAVSCLYYYSYVVCVRKSEKFTDNFQTINYLVGVHDWASTEARKKEPDDFKPGRAQLQLHPL